VAYIYARQTNRRPSDGGVPVSDQQFAELRQSVRESDVEVIGINDRARMAPLLAIFDRGMVIECETRRTFEESRVWFRFNERERAEKRDGLSLPAAGVVGRRLPLLEWYLKHGDPRRWFSKASINAYLKLFRAGLVSAEGLLLLKTATNTQEDWIKAGRPTPEPAWPPQGSGSRCIPIAKSCRSTPRMPTYNASSTT
jgi:hypothetical protein